MRPLKEVVHRLHHSSLTISHASIKLHRNIMPNVFTRNYEALNYERNTTN